MFVEEMQRAVAAAPRERLPALSNAIWKAYAGGAIGEGDAQALAESVEARKAVPALTPARRSSGSRPRSPESTERRRRWTSSGWLPPQLAALFTLAEAAVSAAVVAAEVARHGRCTLTLGHIAALAGVCRTTVRNAMREARLAGLTVEEWRLSAWRSAPNTVKIVSLEWSTWLRLRGRGQGASALQGEGAYWCAPRIHLYIRTTEARRNGPGLAETEPQNRGHNDQGRAPAVSPYRCRRVDHDVDPKQDHAAPIGDLNTPILAQLLPARPQPKKLARKPDAFVPSDINVSKFRSLLVNQRDPVIDVEVVARHQLSSLGRGRERQPLCADPSSAANPRVSRLSHQRLRQAVR